MRYHFLIRKCADGRCLLNCVEIFHCSTVVATRAEVAATARTFLAEYLQAPLGEYRFARPFRGTVSSLCESIGATPDDVLAVPVEASTAFALSLRHSRAVRGISQSRAARLLKINLSAFQRLEDPRRSNPTLKTMKRLTTVFSNLDLRDIFERYEE